MNNESYPLPCPCVCHKTVGFSGTVINTCGHCNPNEVQKMNEKPHRFEHKVILKKDSCPHLQKHTEIRTRFSEECREPHDIEYIITLCADCGEELKRVDIKTK